MRAPYHVRTRFPTSQATPIRRMTRMSAWETVGRCAFFDQAVDLLVLRQQENPHPEYGIWRFGKRVHLSHETLDQARKRMISLTESQISLTESQVNSLPEGTPIRVLWSGGNGPHNYVIAVHEHGRRYAAPEENPNGPYRFYNPLTFVGSEPFHTRVWLR